MSFKEEKNTECKSRFIKPTTEEIKKQELISTLASLLKKYAQQK
ncbi:hypothetical protein [Evansella cellulosilytica]|uniref:Uncharacterized protein n=1 Tax=Evansella cellulosilytica (strain ATCC 21833 / DSM 2522 / FERM P-1141 / JCM 9156 / N-4) TaxID=649639 RepID=E6TZ53_EVAC2|nr:hypothetical protein [Evansella cellulosilytica]ADU32496.1 hypothetical protein Bcell_4269 [Evansella cellulosilytica DSM 2522]